MLNNKRERTNNISFKTDEMGIPINDEIILTVNGESKKLEIFENRLQRAKILFNEFLSIEKESEISAKDKFEKLKKIIEICEINPVYNYYYLKYFLKCLTKENEEEYIEDKEILSETLNNKDFYDLYKTEQSNPANDIYELLCLKINNDTRLEESKKLYIEKQHNLNVPLLKGNEKLRLILYRRRIAEKEINIKSKDIIEKSEGYFKNIDIEKEEFNTLTFLIITYILKLNTQEVKVWLEPYLSQIFEPTLQIENRKYYYKEFGIKIKISEEDENFFIISNDFESISFNANNYCINNLISESFSYTNAPLSILLKRNESYNFFLENKTKIIGDNEIYSAFKDYFNMFINSKLIEDVLKVNHGNILELIKSNKFKGLKLDDEFFKALPLYEKFAQGYTDKDILISFISYFPTMIKNFGEINTKEEYDNIINVYYLFNICSKFIITLHEILIHLCYGYLSYLTDGEINSISPKQSKTNKLINESDGGYFFENILFGCSVKSINLQLIYCLFNGIYLDNTKEKFQDYLKENFNPNNLNNSGLFGIILKKYPINFNMFNYNETTCDMRQILNNNNNINNIIWKRPENDCIVFDSTNKVFRKRKKYN